MTEMLDEAWDLSPAVALRPEPFGAMAYHFGNRKLTFLKRMELVEVVRGLAGHPDVRSTLQAAGVSEAQWPGYVAALQGLASTDMIRQRVTHQASTVQKGVA
ncbi:MAG: mycofactocin biosynthesis chaperone MftB [Aeromicrobium sp.]